MTEQENIETLEKECPANEEKHDKKEDKALKKENKELKKLLEEKEKEIAKLKEENEENINRVKYTQAELVNYRKRKDEEISQREKYCNKDIISDLLPVIDNFERAIKYDDNNLEDQFSKFLSGFKIMFSDLNNILMKYGVTPINRVGEEFDSRLEQALLTDKVEGKKDEEVLEVLLKGYMLHDRVIRPATVKINKID